MKNINDSEGEYLTIDELLDRLVRYYRIDQFKMEFQKGPLFPFVDLTLNAIKGVKWKV